MTSMMSVQLDGRVSAALAAGRWGEVVGLVADGELAPDLSMVGVLESVDPAWLDAQARVDLVRAWERVRAMLDGRAAGRDGRGGRGDRGGRPAGGGGAGSRSAPPCGCPRRRPGIGRWWPWRLRDRLPGALGALPAGDLSYLQAAHLAGAVRDLPRPRSRRGAGPGAGPGRRPEPG